MKKIQLRLLRAIQKHDRQWGNFQLDRVVNSKEIPEGSTVTDVLNSLEAQGWIEKCVCLPTNRYAITSVGRCALIQSDCV